jgi:hypothetical protein
LGNGVAEIPYNGILQDSLSAIKQAHRQLHVVTGAAATTPAVLMSRIELYGTLLGEIADIRSNLVAYLEFTCAGGQIPGRMECVRSDPLQEVSSL